MQEKAKKVLQLLIKVYLKIRRKRTYWSIAVPLGFFFIGELTKLNEPLVKYISQLSEDVQNWFGKVILKIISIYLSVEIPWYVTVLLAFFFIVISVVRMLESRENAQVKLFLEKFGKQKIIALSDLQLNFQKSKAGWLSERYIPTLHFQGRIQNEIEGLLFSKKFREESIQKLMEDYFLIEKTVEEIHLFLETTDNHELDKKLKEIEVNILSFQKQLYFIVDQLNNENEIFECQKIEEVYIWDTMLELEKLPVNSSLKNLIPKLTDNLKKVHQMGVQDYIKNYPASFAPHNIIFFGAAGSGKTHGLANAVEKRLDENLPAIIIDAQQVPPFNWLTIFQTSLGLSSTWKENELFEQLNLLGNQSTDGKILVCIDGLDEVSDYKSWKFRIDELKEYLSIYPNIRFAISSRYYPPRMNLLGLEITDYGIGNRDCILMNNSDVDFQFLKEKYLEHYNVDFSNSPWVIHAIKSPLELRLFCQEYENKPVPSNAKTNLVSLIKSKIERLEKEIFQKVENDWIEDDHLPHRVLTELSKLFYNSDYPIIERKIIYSNILSGEMNDFLNRESLSQILDFFCKHGVLLKIPIFSNDEIAPTDYTFRFPYESILELIFANTFIKEIVDNGKKDIPESIKNETRVLELVATSLLVDYNIMVGEDGLWAEDLERHTINFIRLRALSDAGFLAIEKNKKWIKEKLIESEELRFFIMKFLIIPATRIPNHPIGGIFLHEILKNFPNVFSRDLVWSGLDFPKEILFRNGRLLIPYFADREFSTSHQEFVLKLDDEFDALPLVFAWSLTSIENVYRENCRVELSRWGGANPLELVKLLELVFDTDDMQMKEDLSIVARGAASLIDKNNKAGLRALADWSLRTIFQESKLLILRSPIIRQSGRLIVEKAFQFGLIENDEVEKTRPPFNLPFEFLDLEKDVLENYQEEYSPIEHDLAWYVIGKSYEGLFGAKYSDENGSPEFIDFLEKYKETTKTEDLWGSKFAMAAAIKMIKKTGYNRTSSNWASATHGSKSGVATFEEKYTWIAVHHIMGYLADYLRYDFSEMGNPRYEWIKDYNHLLQIPNSAFPVLLKEVRLQRLPWLIPENLAPRIVYNESNKKQEVVNYVHRKPEIDFSRWLTFTSEKMEGWNLPNGSRWFSLSNFSKFADPNKFTTTSLSVTTCFIKEDKFELFKKYSSTTNPFPISSTLDLKSTPYGSTYISPMDVVEMSWIEDVYEHNEFFDKKEKSYSVHYGVSEVVENTIEESDLHYRIPSKITRRLIGVEKFDGKYYYNQNEDFVGISNKLGSSYKDDKQELILIDENLLLENLKKEGLKEFWIVSLFRNLSLDFREEHKVGARHMFVWMVWKDSGHFYSSLIKDDNYRRVASKTK